MTKNEFRQMCREGLVFMDGATGTNLMKAGMPAGACPEAWILDHQEVLLNLQRAYVEAGSQILLAPTFTGNRIKLADYGLENDLEKINRSLVALSKRAAEGRALVAGDMTMTGRQLKPMGDLDFEVLTEVYKEQARVLVDAGVDLFVIETMMSLNESRAALLAVREVCDLPVCVTLSFNEDGRTLFGTDAATAMVVLQSLGADAVGANCSSGPLQMADLIREMKHYANIPVIAKPNAGMPEIAGGETIYRMTPEAFAREMAVLLEAGAGILGGCCGTTPDHIRALKAYCGFRPVPEISDRHIRALASERKTLEIPLNGPFMVIGERINPTGKEKLKAALKAKDMDTVVAMAESQEARGAAILDINMGMNGIDEKEMMLKAVQAVTEAVNLPLCIDSSHIDVIEAALRIYPGRALINSISLEKEKVERLLPVAAKYGAMFILLPLSDEGLPPDLESKHEMIRTLLEKALALGFAKEDIIVDGLVTTIGANPRAALETLATIAYCHDELGLATVCGLSNISFGLPQRSYVNAAFLTMAMAKGLTMAIANPSQDLLMHTAFASDLLLHKPASDTAYIEHMAAFTDDPAAPAKAAKEPGDPVYQAVLKGNREKIGVIVDQALAEGRQPKEIIETSLIPAINQVGKYFEDQTYFLPQLIASAEAMEKGIARLTPLLSADAKDQKATVILATVEGDIHDIGKNLVALMLRNYGYRVLDLGKDVSAEKIVAAAAKEGAAIIGLSALMTTTMMRMKDVVDCVREKGCSSKVIIGGAVTTQSFADEIGADGYSGDAASAVTLVDHLLENQ